jgi:hypothetical protein
VRGSGPGSGVPGGTCRAGWRRSPGALRTRALERGPGAAGRGRKRRAGGPALPAGEGRDGNHGAAGRGRKRRAGGPRPCWPGRGVSAAPEALAVAGRGGRRPRRRCRGGERLVGGPGGPAGAGRGASAAPEALPRRGEARRRPRRRWPCLGEACRRPGPAGRGKGTGGPRAAGSGSSGRR